MKVQIKIEAIIETFITKEKKVSVVILAIVIPIHYPQKIITSIELQSISTSLRLAFPLSMERQC